MTTTANFRDRIHAVKNSADARTAILAASHAISQFGQSNEKREIYAARLEAAKIDGDEIAIEAYTNALRGMKDAPTDARVNAHETVNKVIGAVIKHLKEITETVNFVDADENKLNDIVGLCRNLMEQFPQAFPNAR